MSKTDVVLIIFVIVLVVGFGLAFLYASRFGQRIKRLRARWQALVDRGVGELSEEEAQASGRNLSEGMLTIKAHLDLAEGNLKIWQFPSAWRHYREAWLKIETTEVIFPPPGSSLWDGES